MYLLGTVNHFSGVRTYFCGVNGQPTEWLSLEAVLHQITCLSRLGKPVNFSYFTESL